MNISYSFIGMVGSLLGIGAAYVLPSVLRLAHMKMSREQGKSSNSHFLSLYLSLHTHTLTHTYTHTHPCINTHTHTHTYILSLYHIASRPKEKRSEVILNHVILLCGIVFAGLGGKK